MILLVQALTELAKYERALQDDYAKEEPGGDLVGNYRVSLLAGWLAGWLAPGVNGVNSQPGLGKPALMTGIVDLRLLHPSQL